MTSGGAKLVARELRGTLLCTSLLLAATACDSRSGAADASDAAVQPAATSQPSVALRDWVRNPLVDQEESRGSKMRIISTAPNVTEICCALGLRDNLVSRTRYCEYPPEIAEVTSIGALTDVNIEALIAIHPDLIIVSGTSRAQAERLEAAGLRFESVPDASIADLFAAIRRIGALAARPKTAEKLCENLQGELDRVTRRYASAQSRRVLLLIGPLSDPPRPPFVAGPGSFYDDLLRMAGHSNVVPAEHTAFAPLSLEFVVRANPGVIVEIDAEGAARPDGDEDALRAWRKVGNIRAVDEGTVRVIRGRQHLLLGPRIAFTYKALCRAIAGEPDE